MGRYRRQAEQTFRQETLNPGFHPVYSTTFPIDQQRWSEGHKAQSGRCFGQGQALLAGGQSLPAKAGGHAFAPVEHRPVGIAPTQATGGDGLIQPVRPANALRRASRHFTVVVRQLFHQPHINGRLQRKAPGSVIAVGLAPCWLAIGGSLFEPDVNRHFIGHRRRRQVGRLTTSLNFGLLDGMQAARCCHIRNLRSACLHTRRLRLRLCQPERQKLRQGGGLCGRRQFGVGNRVASGEFCTWQLLTAGRIQHRRTMLAANANRARAFGRSSKVKVIVVEIDQYRVWVALTALHMGGNLAHFRIDLQFGHATLLPITLARQSHLPGLDHRVEQGVCDVGNHCVESQLPERCFYSPACQLPIAITVSAAIFIPIKSYQQRPLNLTLFD